MTGALPGRGPTSKPTAGPAEARCPRGCRAGAAMRWTGPGGWYCYACDEDYPASANLDRALNADETRAVRALTRLAARWPRSLTLVSTDGSLSILDTDPVTFAAEEDERGAHVIANLGGLIPNTGTGGGW